MSADWQLLWSTLENSGSHTRILIKTDVITEVTVVAARLDLKEQHQQNSSSKQFRFVGLDELGGASYEAATLREVSFVRFSVVHKQ